MLKLIRAASVLALVCAMAAPAAAAPIVANVILDYFDSTGKGFLNQTGNRTAVPAGYATDGNASTYISLPTGSYLVLGFSGGGVVVDGTGNDLFVAEVGSGGEFADVFISSNGGTSFTLLGRAGNSGSTAFDLASIGFSGAVNAVKVVGLNNGGSSPGFDLAYVEGLEGSTAVVPLPAAGLLLMGGLVGLGAVGRRRRG